MLGPLIETILARHLHPEPSADRDYMAQALALAEGARHQAAPNPAVGCVIVSSSGTVLGQGATQEAGGPHAEIMALRDAGAQGNSVAGATVYVTLEPCSHHGRTGPCCDALRAAGVARVVAATKDPNPLVNGQGFARLRAAGVQVDVGVGEAAARELNLGFFSRMRRGRPWVRLKIAASLDGRTALENGQSQWLTGEAARLDGHRWRARAGTLLTGIGTVLEDNPRLDVRLADAGRQPALVVVDSQLQTPADARLFERTRPIRIFTAVHGRDEQAGALRARGAEITCMPNAQGKVDLGALLHELGTREVNELHVEAGHKLNGSLLREGWVDELLLYVAPKWIGAGRGLADRAHPDGVLTSLEQALALEFKSVDSIDKDLRIVARLKGRDLF